MQSLICPGASFFLVFGFAFLASDRSWHDMILVSCSVPCWNKSAASLQTHTHIYIYIYITLCSNKNPQILQHVQFIIGVTLKFKEYLLLLTQVEVYLNATLFHLKKDRPVFFRLLDRWKNSREKTWNLGKQQSSTLNEDKHGACFAYLLLGLTMLGTSDPNGYRYYPKWWCNGDVFHLQLLWKLDRYVCTNIQIQIVSYQQIGAHAALWMKSLSVFLAYFGYSKGQSNWEVFV